jgi:predicted 3-demethylubiquinone-9 3-methyltransferase (glyoxalase superfamily)
MRNRLVQGQRGKYPGGEPTPVSNEINGNYLTNTEFLGGNQMQKVTPCLWFDNQAEEAANFYVSIFKNSKVGSVARYGEEGAKVSGRPKGTVMTVIFQLDGQEFMALNGGPMFKFTEAISFMVNCKTQQEVDELWQKLSQGGEEGPCGWLKARYGLSWQIVPTVLGEMLQDKDPEKSERVMKAMLQMKKLDIASLKQAYEKKEYS